MDGMIKKYLKENRITYIFLVPEKYMAIENKTSKQIFVLFFKSGIIITKTIPNINKIPDSKPVPDIPPQLAEYLSVE